MDPRTRQAMREAPARLSDAAYKRMEAAQDRIHAPNSEHAGIHHVWVNPLTRRIDPENATEGEW